MIKKHYNKRLLIAYDACLNMLNNITLKKHSIAIKKIILQWEKNIVTQIIVIACNANLNMLHTVTIKIIHSMEITKQHMIMTTNIF